MITLFCDLDSTLIYSHRRFLPEPKQVAEYYRGREQSYITEKTLLFLSECRSLSVVPVTARTIPQYDRLNLLIRQLNCTYALVLNGAILLKNGEVDEQWMLESDIMAQRSKDEMKRVLSLMERSADAVQVRYCDRFMIYAAAEDPGAVRERLIREADCTLVTIFSDSRKVYCVPSAFTKGAAAARLTAQILPELTVAVGDSENDLSLLEVAEIPIAPECLGNRIINPNKVLIPDCEVLSDQACEVISALLEQRSEPRSLRDGNGSPFS